MKKDRPKLKYWRMPILPAKPSKDLVIESLYQALVYARDILEGHARILEECGQSALGLRRDINSIDEALAVVDDRAFLSPLNKRR